jgi:hypothetical protein
MSRLQLPMQRAFNDACAAFDGVGKVRAMVLVIDAGGGTYEVVHGSALSASVLSQLLQQQAASLDAQTQKVAA